ncbi:hypothetical protein E4U53_000492, partial [Claviceps sorghi]
DSEYLQCNQIITLALDSDTTASTAHAHNYETLLPPKAINPARSAFNPEKHPIP